MPLRRLSAILTAVAGVAAGLAAVTSTPGAAASPVQRTPSPVGAAAVADAYVAADQPRTPHDDAWASMSASPVRRAYFTFSVVVPAGHQVTSAVFRCFPSRTNLAGLQLWRTTNNWTERTLTWSTAPSPDFRLPAVAASGPVYAGAYAAVNVTSVVTGTGTYTFVARTLSVSRWSCAARENAVNRPPRLLVTTAPGPTTVGASADAYTAQDQPRSAHNNAYLSLDASPRHRAYFRFSVVVPAGQRVVQAVFRCYATRSSAVGLSLWRAGNGWSESTLTWNNAALPNFSAPPVGSTGPVTAFRYASADVTAAIAGSGSYTLVGRTTSAAQWSCLSKEHPNAARARLVVRTVAAVAVVDAIGDGGPAATDWNAGLSARIRADAPAALLWAGDVRMSGTPAEWALYDQHYGPLTPVTLPTPGNHDWASAATGYDVEFAGNAPYADIDDYCNGITLPNGWKLFSINSYGIAGCLSELQAFLAAPGTRKIVVTHEPRYSGGSHGSDLGQDPIWQAMRGHAFALVAGHDHDGQLIERDGLVQSVSGCGGASYTNVTPISGTVYYTTSAADCTYQRFVLSTDTATVQAVRPDGSVAFTKTYPVTP